jgi:NAD(P)H dehydrogenase (quinone)
LAKYLYHLLPQEIARIAMAKVMIVFDTRYGNTMRLAETVAEGVNSYPGAEALFRRVEIVEPEVIIQRNDRWKEANAKSRKVPEVSLEELLEIDALVLGSPTRYGVMTAPMKKFIDSTGKVWLDGGLAGKVGAAFTSTSTPHGGQEMTILSLIIPMLHHGMILVTPGYIDPATFVSGSPYGATSVSGGLSDRPPTESDSKVARFLGRRVAEIATQLKFAREKMGTK